MKITGIHSLYLGKILIFNIVNLKTFVSYIFETEQRTFKTFKEVNVFYRKPSMTIRNNSMFYHNFFCLPVKIFEDTKPK